MTFDPKALLARVPLRPGVYLMRDVGGRVFYVGKARDLRRRLQQYFSGHDERAWLHLLDGLLDDVEVLVTANEKEALVLENQLIKEHQPRFNVLLKDDKNFLRVRIDPRHPFPRVEVARQRREDGSLFFGPYHSARAIREVVHLLNRVFRLRTCTDRAFAGRDRPCLRHQMHVCDAPCVKVVDSPAYRARVDDVVLFLRGRRKELQRRLRRDMEEASESLDFERALALRDTLAAMERAVQPQAVDLHGDEDLDVVALHRDGERAAALVAAVREGRTLYTWEYQFRRLPAVDAGELMAQVVERHYAAVDDLPPEVLVSEAPEDGLEALGTWLTARAGRRVQVKRPQRGPRRALVEWAVHNAAERFREATGVEERRYAELADLGRLLGLPEMPRVIEGYDISNLHGQVAYGSQVVFVDGVPEKARYRSYKIRTVQGSDDFAMLAEVLARRLKEGRRADLPDVFLIDGGKGQVAAARAIVHDALGVDRPVVGLAKDRVRANPLGRDLERSGERLVHGAPLVETPLDAHEGVLRLLVRVRDEAHRAAVGAHRKGRTLRDLEGVLDRVPGVGKARKRALLMRYATIARLVAEGVACDWNLPGVPRPVCAALRAALAPSESEHVARDLVGGNGQDVAQPGAQQDGERRPGP